MGNASRRQQLFADGAFDELLTQLDATRPTDLLIRGAVLFAKGALDDFMAFTDAHLSSNDSLQEEQWVTWAGLATEQALVRFLLGGGLGGSRGTAVSQATDTAEEAFHSLGEAKSGKDWGPLINACLLMFRGHAGAGSRVALESAMQAAQGVLRPPGEAPDDGFVRQFLASVILGLCALKLFYLTRDPLHLRTSARSAHPLLRLLPADHMLRDLWLQPLEALDLWVPIGALPAHQAACSREPEPLTWDSISQVFVGQAPVVAELRTIFEQRQRKLLPADRPVVLWFSGASGHGKTFLAQLLADILHGTDGHAQEAGKLVVINCQNLRTAESVNSLVDPPTGIRGHGPLITGLERHGDAVILLDELDKAMVSAVENIFLPAFERGGYLQSAKDGRVVRTSQAVFIITSNFGAEAMKQDAAQYVAGNSEERAKLEAAWRRTILSRLQATYSPPFLNRSTAHLFLFTPYNTEECERAVDLELHRWAAHLLRASGTLVQWTSAVTKYFADHFEQFHGQKVVVACAESLNRAINAGRTSTYYLLRATEHGLVAETLEAAVAGARPAAAVIRAALPDSLLPPEEPVPATGDLVLQRVLASLPQSTQAPIMGDRAAASAAPEAIPSAPVVLSTAPSAMPPAEVTVAESSPPPAETEPDEDLAPELQQEQQRRQQAEAEADRLRERLGEVERERDSLRATCLQKDAEIARLVETVRQLQLSLVAQFVVIGVLVWAVSCLIPTKLLAVGLLSVAVACWAAWPHIAWWLLPLLAVVRRVLGDGGAAGLAVVLAGLILQRLQVGPARVACA